MLRKFIFITLLISPLGGCGTYVPNIQEIPGDDADGQLLVHAIVNSIHCEVRNAVYTVIQHDKNASVYNGGIRYAKYLEGWGVQIGLTLQIEEKSSVNPTAIFTPPYVFSLAGTGLASSDATRIDKLNYYYTVKELLALGPCPATATPPNPLTSLLIQSDLKLSEWLSDQVMESGTGNIAVPLKVNSPLKQNALSHEVKFEVITSGGLTPTWKLARVSVNPTGTLLAASRDRIHDLLITFGPVDPTQKGSLAPTAQSLFIASQFGIAVNNARTGVLP